MSMSSMPTAASLLAVLVLSSPMTSPGQWSPTRGSPQSGIGNVVLEATKVTEADLDSSAQIVGMDFDGEVVLLVDPGTRSMHLLSRSRLDQITTVPWDDSINYGFVACLYGDLIACGVYDGIALMTRSGELVGRIEGPVRLPMSVDSRDKADSEMLLVGYYGEDRIHLIDRRGRVKSSGLRDRNLDLSDGYFAVSGDRAYWQGDRVICWHPAEYAIAVLSPELAVSTVYSLPPPPQYRPVEKVDWESFDSISDAKRHYAESFTPLVLCMHVRDSEFITVIRVGPGNYRYDLWRESSGIEHVAEVVGIGGYPVGAADGMILSVAASAGRNRLQFWSLPNH